MKRIPEHNTLLLSSPSISIHLSAIIRGGSRNVEGGVLVVCRPLWSNFVLAWSLQRAVHRGAYGRLLREARNNFL